MNSLKRLKPTVASRLKFQRGVNPTNRVIFKAHIRHIRTKVSKTLAIINKAKQFLDQHALRTLYCSLVLPYFTYCVEVWGNNYLCSLQPLVILQKRAVRIIHKAGFLDHSNNLFIQSKLLKFHDLVKYYTVQILFKAFNKLLPSNIQKLFTAREQTCGLRGFGNFKIPLVRTTRKSFCVSVCGVKLWNCLDLQYKQCQNIHNFKFLYKQLVWLCYREGGV